MIKNNQIIIWRSFFISLIPVLIWMVIIFCFSSMRGNGYDGVPTFWFYFERKGAHIAEYLILNLLLIRLTLKGFLIFTKKEAIIIASVSSLIYALTDEIHQLFVYGREGKLTDIGFDLIGIIIAIILSGLFFKFRK